MSSKNNFRKIPTLGIILIAVGLLLLADQIGIMRMSFWNFAMGFMVLFGATLVIRSFSRGDRNKVFWGTALFLLGLYFIFDSLDLITDRYTVIVPALFLILGFSFLMMYVYNLRDWHLLIPTIFFTGIGVLIFADSSGFFDLYRLENYLLNFWPLLLILFGVGLIAKSRRRKQIKGNPVIE
jgi:hypothetical protein